MNNIPQLIRSFFQRNFNIIFFVFQRFFLLFSVVYICILLFVYFPDWQKYINVKYLGIFFVLQGSLLLFYYKEVIIRFFQYYFSFLRSYLFSFFLLLFFIIPALLIFFPKEDIHHLVEPAVITLVIALYLSITEKKKIPYIFDEILLQSKFSIVAIVAGGGFVSYFVYKFGFLALNLPYPVTSSIFCGFVFCLGVVFFGTDGVSLFRKNFFSEFHSQSVKKYQRGLYVIFGFGFLFSTLSAYGFYHWYGEYKKIKDQSWRVEILAKLPIYTSEKTPSNQLGDIQNSEFSPSLISLLESAKNQELGDLNEDTLSPGSSSGSISSREKTSDNASENKLIGEVFTWTRYIGIGDRGEDVKWIQEYLKQLGYYTGPINRQYDKETSSALNLYIQKETATSSDYSLLGPRSLKIFKGLKYRDK